MSTTKLQINQIDHSLMGDKNVQCIFILLNGLANLVSGEAKCSSQNKMKGRNGCWMHRYSPYEIEKIKGKKKSRKKIKMKSTSMKNTAQSSFGSTHSNFLFLDDMFTMSSKEVCEIARNGHGYKLILSNSQDSLKSDEAIEIQSRITVSKAPGTYWIKYS